MRNAINRYLFSNKPCVLAKTQQLALFSRLVFEVNFSPNLQIFVNLWTAHHSAEWGDPFTFRPERFLDESGRLLPATHPIRKG